MSDRNAETRAAFERLAQSAKDCLRTYERVTGRVPAAPAEVHDERREAEMVTPGGWTACRCAERAAAASGEDR